MNIRKKTRIYVYLLSFSAFVMLYLLLSPKPVISVMAKNEVPSTDISQKYFPGAKIKEVYRLRLEPGDLLLESINELIKRENIKDGAVTLGIGTLSECCMHWVITTGFPSVQKKETIKAPLELLSLQGIIADGVPHLHISVSDTSRAIGGHIEEGCKVLYVLEVVIESYEGTPLTRRPNKYGNNTLQKLN